MSTGREPDFKGDGVAVWVNEKDGKKSLAIKIVGHEYIYAFRYIPKPKPKTNDPLA